MTRPVAKREGGWVFYDAPLPKPTALHRHLIADDDVAASLLRLSASLPVGCKYAMDGASDLRVRVEQPEPPEAGSATRMAELDAGFSAAASRLSVAAAAKPGDVESLTDAPAQDLASLCRETAWPFEQRPDGVLVVDLAVNGSYVPALVCARASGIAIEANVVTQLPDPGECRSALAALLLRVNGAFRMVRAVFCPAEHGSQAQLEAPLPADASAAELSTALGAVAVAAQHCAAEAQLLAHSAGLARAYLAGVAPIAIPHRRQQAKVQKTRVRPKRGPKSSPTAVVGRA